MADKKLPTCSFKTSDFIPPGEGELRWIFIDQPGKENLQGKMCLNASLYVKTDSDGCKKLKAAIEEFYREYQDKGQIKSMGWRDEVYKDSEGNFLSGPDGEIVEEPVKTGETSFNFWTGATWPDGKPHVIDIYNTKGVKIHLGGKKIGNGSLGAIAGTMGIYDQSATGRGVTLYLNAIQIYKFVEFSADPGFGDAGEDIEGGFEGVETEFDQVGSDEETPATPQL